MAREIYVNPEQGNDSVEGYKANPFKTIAQAIETAWLDEKMNLKADGPKIDSNVGADISLLPSQG